MKRANAPGAISLTIAIALPGAAFAQSAKDLVETWMLVTADAYGSPRGFGSALPATDATEVSVVWP